MSDQVGKQNVGFLMTRLIFVFMDIFVAIYFCRLQNWTMKEQCTVCLYRHISDDLLSKISLSRKNKSLAKINWLTVYKYVRIFFIVHR